MINYNFIIFGGCGDLALRKLYPALCALLNQKQDYQCQIYGVSRRTISDSQFIDLVKPFMQLSTQVDADAESTTTFYSKLAHIEGDISSKEVYRQIKAVTKDAINIFYLATPPSLFVTITKLLKTSGILDASSRVVVEKPLGDDEQSFNEIHSSLCASVPQQQLFLIDHYLGKETVQNLLALRFANQLFEPIWNCQFIDSVQLTVSENVGIENRWHFYDQCGALRDMVQNHLLQLLCLIAIEQPSSLNAEALKQEKLKVLRCLQAISGEQVLNNTVRAQYASGVIDGKVVPGYIEEDAANTDSSTETFVAIKAFINNKRWHNVPFYMRTGKRLNRKTAEIVIKFKPIAYSIFPNLQHSNTQSSNILKICLQPEESIKLAIQSKKPSLDRDISLSNVELNLDLYDNENRAPSAYARLLHDVMLGDHTLFMHKQEIQLAWQWTDKIISGWRQHNMPISSYASGSWGPDASTALISRDSREWIL